MNIVVTGGLGFQGSHLIEKWSDSHNITIINTPSDRATKMHMHLIKKYKYRIVWANMTDSEIVEKLLEDCDVVVHLAAWANPDKSIERPWDAFYANVYGTHNVMMSALKSGSRVILGSSCEVYGECAPGCLQSEVSTLNPKTPYAASKASSDRLAYAYAKTYGIKTTIVRPCNIFGPRQREGKYGGVIPNFVQSMLQGKPALISGDGSQSREYMYIDDLVCGYDLILNYAQESGVDVFNLGTQYRPSILAIAEYLANKLRGSYKLSERRLGDVHSFNLDSSKAKAIFSFESKVDFYTGLDTYVTWAHEKCQS